MNVQFHVLGLNANRRIKEMVLPYLKQLHRQISISSAVVVLDCTRNGGPPFTARVHLAVPGPDIHAEARDHTLQAAWRKVCKNLEKHIERRKSRQGTQAARQDRRLRKVNWGLPGLATMPSEDFFLRASARPQEKRNKNNKVKGHEHEKQKQRAPTGRKPYKP